MHSASAGYCYVGAFEIEGAEYVVSLLGCGWPNNKEYNVKNGILEDSRLFDKVKVPLKTQTAKKSFDVVKSEEETIVKIIQLPESINGPLKKGTRVGKILYKINGHTVGEFPVVTAKKVRNRNYFRILLEIIDIYLKCSYN